MDLAEPARVDVLDLTVVIYSNPPAHGSAVVTHILTNPELRAQWEIELREMRERIQSMRKLFVTTLRSKGISTDFSFIERQNGMFSYSGLSVAQVLKMREQSAVYAVESGRFNVAAMTRDNMDALCEAIARVLDD